MYCMQLERSGHRYLQRSSPFENSGPDTGLSSGEYQMQSDHDHAASLAQYLASHRERFPPYSIQPLLSRVGDPCLPQAVSPSRKAGAIRLRF